MEERAVDEVARVTVQVIAPGRRRHLFALALWTVLCGFFFRTILTGRECLPGGDLSGQFHAFGVFQAREMAQGRWPVWSPGSNGGFPFAADVQSAVCYPPRWLTILLSARQGFPFYALELEAIFHLWLAGVFTYALACSLTGEPPAALIGAVAFALGGYLTSYPMLQVAVLETVTWLPLALLLLRAAASRPRPVPWLVGAGLALALSALAGHPQTFLHASYLAAAYYLFLALRARWAWRWILLWGGLVAVIALGASAAALLPALHFLSHTVRHDVSYSFVATGLPMLDLLQVLVPGVLSFWTPEYAGLPALALALVAVWGRHKGERAEVLLWGLTALASAWLALGDKGVLFGLAYHVAPGLSLFQHQERLLGITSLSLALLASQGAATWLHAEEPLRRALARRVGATLAVALALAGLVLAAAQSTAFRPWWPIWARQWPILAVALAALWWRPHSRRHLWALVLVLGVDLYVATYGAVNRQPGPPGAYWPEPAWLDELRSQEPARVDTGRLFFANVGEIYSLEEIRGISPLRPQALVDLEKALPPERRWQLLNVTHVLAAEVPAETSLAPAAVIDEGLIPGQPLKGAVYRFDKALPRAWLSYRPVRVPDAPAALQLLQDPAFDLAASVALHTDVEGVAEVMPPAPGSGPPTVRTSRPHPGELEIEVASGAPGILVVSEWHWAGWQATVDGAPALVYPADYALLALLVPGGTHRVRLRYLPAWELGGAAVSLAALLAAAALAWRWRPVAVRRPASPVPAPRTVAAGARPAGRAGWPGWRCLAVAVILLGFGLRVFRLGHQELRGDEAFSYQLAHRPLAEILPAVLHQGDPHSPLHYWLLHGWMGLAGQSELALRYASLVPGVLLLALACPLARRLRGPGLGVLAAGLLAISQSQVWIGQDLRNQYTLALAFSTLATLLLARALARPRWQSWALYAAAAALSLYSHYYGAFALLAHAVCALAMPRWRLRLRGWAAGSAAAALAFVPWIVAVWPYLARAGQLYHPAQPELAAYLVEVGTELAAGPSFGRPVGRWLFLGALALCVLGTSRLRRQQPAWAALLALWLGGAALGIYLLRFSRGTFNTFYIAVAAPAWWALVGAGIAELWERREWLPRVAAAGALAALVAANGLSLKRYFLDPAYGRSNGYRAIAAHVADQLQPGDVFVRNQPDPCFDYYLENLPLNRTMAPTAPGVRAEEMGEALLDLARQYDRLWFVPARGSTWDPEGAAQHWLEYNTLLEQEATYRGQTLLAYRPVHAAPEVMVPLDLPVNGLLRLAGAFVAVDGRPARLEGQPLAIPPGATVRVTLLWEALAETDQSYTVFVHLAAEDGRLVAQHDGIPVFGSRPTWVWKAGERILDRHDIAVPAGVAGRGSMLVGVYDSETVERQRFADGRDAVPLAEVRYAGGSP